MELPEDSCADVTDEELRLLQYVDELDVSPDLPTWEYDVVRLKSDAEAGSVRYTSELLNRMGEKGWELVSIVPLDGKNGQLYGVFRRCWHDDLEEQF